MIDMYDKAGNGENPAINMAKSGPTVILFVGVNGVGKTTTIGKMAKMYKDQGKKLFWQLPIPLEPALSNS